MFVRDHAQKLVNAVRNLPLRSGNSNLVTRLLGAGEANLAIVLLLEFINLGKATNKLAMVKSVDANDLRGIL
jgi:hypothetical protein